MIPLRWNDHGSGTWIHSHRRNVLSLFACFTFLFSCQFAWSSPISLTNDSASYAVGSSLEYFEDPTGSLTIDSILEDASLAFKEVEGDVPNFNFTPSAYWFRIRLNNEGDNPDWYLEFHYSLLDEVDLFLRYEDRMEEQQHGDIYPFSQRQVEHRNFVAPIVLEKGEAVELIFRVRTESSLQLPLTLWSKEEFYAKEHHEQYFYGFYYGILLVMMAYSSMMSALISDKAYFYYFLHIFGYGMVQLSLNGYAFEYLWPDNPWWANKATPFFIGIGFIGVSTFTMSFLELKTHHPRLNAGFKVFFYLCVFICVSSLVMDYQFVIKIATAASGIIALCACGAGYISWRSGFKPARYFLLAWSVFFLGIAAYVLKTFGMVPNIFLTDHGMQIGSTLEMFLLSFALADRINILTNENKRMHREANILLQQEVEKRTAELEKMTEAAIKSSEEANRAKDLAEAATKSKSEFLATMSHEIRTPMNGVMGMADLLKETHLSSQQSEYINTIENSGKALLGVINDILDFSKIEAGKMTIEAVEFDLEKLIDECTSIFSFQISENNVKLYVQSAPRTIGAIEGDPTRVRQIVINMLSNAFKFTDRGRVELSYEIEEEVDGFQLIRFTIRDSGIGMTQEQIAKVFGSFSQADTSTTRKYGGTGLGLAISRQLVELMGGTIDVESQPGIGSTFTFTILAKACQQRTVREQSLSDWKVDFISSDTYGHRLNQAHLTYWGCKTSLYANIHQFMEAVEASSEKDVNSFPDILFVDFEGNEEILTVIEMFREKGICDKLKKLVVFGNAGLVPMQELFSHAGQVSTLEQPVTASKLYQFILNVKNSAKVRQNKSDDQLSLQHLKVLVAEDNIVNQTVIKGLLGKFGIRPVLAANGLEAVAAVTDQGPYDLIFMDCEMPELDGFAATTEIRKIEHDLGVQCGSTIVALTAHALSEHKEACEKAGMNGHLTKPISKSDLKSFLDSNFSH